MGARRFWAVLALLIAVIVLAQMLTSCAPMHSCATDKHRAGCYLDPECHCPGERRWPA